MSSHVAPLSLYLRIFATLIVLTVLTVAVAFFDFGAFNDVIMLTIAITKATLVILYFMHVRWSGKLVWLFAASGFLWLLILFAITFADVISRDWIPIDGMAGSGMWLPPFDREAKVKGAPSRRALFLFRD